MIKFLCFFLVTLHAAQNASQSARKPATDQASLGIHVNFNAIKGKITVNGRDTCELKQFPTSPFTTTFCGNWIMDGMNKIEISWVRLPVHAAGRTRKLEVVLTRKGPDGFPEILQQWDLTAEKGSGKIANTIRFRYPPSASAPAAAAPKNGAQ